MVNYLTTDPKEFQRVITGEANRAARWFEKQKAKFFADDYERARHDHPLVEESRKKKRPVFDQSITYDPTTTGNHWHVMRYIEDNAHNVSLGIYSDLFHIIGIGNNGASLYAYYVIYNADKTKNTFIAVFTPHFWQRYKTRTKSELDGEELIVDFFKRETTIPYFFVDLIRPDRPRQNKRYRDVSFELTTGAGYGVCINEKQRIYECRTYLDNADLPPLKQYIRRWQRKHGEMLRQKQYEYRMKYDDPDKVERALAMDLDLYRAFYRSTGEKENHANTMANLAVLCNIIEDSLPHKEVVREKTREKVFRKQFKLICDFAHSHGQAKYISLNDDDVYRFMVEAAEIAKNELNIYEVCIFLDAFNKAANGKYGNLEELANLAKQVTDDAREHPEKYPETWRRAEARVNSLTKPSQEGKDVE